MRAELEKLAQPGPTSKLAVAVGVLLIAVSGFGIWHFSKPVNDAPNIATLAPVSASQPVIDYAGLVRAAAQEADNKALVAHRTFLASLVSSRTRHEPVMSYAAEQASTHATEMEPLSYAIYYAAKDELLKRGEAEAYLHAELDPYLRPPVSNFSTDINTEVVKLDRELQRISTQLAVDVASIGPSVAASSRKLLAPQEIEAAYQQVLKSLGQRGLGAGANLLNTGWRGNGVQDAKLIRTASQLVAKSFGKQIAKATASATLVAADGPLPIGDMLAIIGLAWTGYDIYDMRLQFRSDLRASLKAALDSACAEVNKRAEVFSSQKMAEYQRVRSDVALMAVSNLTGKQGK